MDIREAVKDKANYSSIVTYFKTLKEPDLDQMILLIDVIGQMSPEIYEHYRALQDIFRREIKKAMAEEQPGRSEKLAYIIGKGCGTGTLLAEKYESFL